MLTLISWGQTWNSVVGGRGTGDVAQWLESRIAEFKSNGFDSLAEKGEGKFPSQLLCRLVCA